MYVEDIVREFPDGATAALFYINNDFGQVYSDAFEELAGEQQHRDRRHPDDRGARDRAAAGPDRQHRRQRPGRDHGRRRSAPSAPTFASELVNAKAANPGWEPRVYITNTCASPLILGIAGAAADGLITSSNQGLKDIGNAEIAQADPEIVDVHRLHDGAGARPTRSRRAPPGGRLAR